MERPTASQVRAVSPLLRETYPEAGDPHEAFEDALDLSASLVSAITGRDIGVGAGEEVPANLIPLAILAVAMKTEHGEVRFTAAARRRVSGRFYRLTGFTAGSYSETYADPTRRTGGRPVLDADAELDEVLWLLMTEDMRAQVIAENDPDAAPPPGYAIESFQWAPGLGSGREY